MTIRIKREGLALPVSTTMALYLADLLAAHEKEKAVTINFRDPYYSADDGGYHPVEIRIVNDGTDWQLCYITDFCFVGSGYNAELAKDLDFDFQVGIFQNFFGTYPIEQGIDMFQIWESNFIYHATVAKAFTIQLTSD